MKKLVLFLLIGMGVCSCGPNWLFDKLQESYNELKQIYPENFTDHFPVLCAENIRYAYFKFPKGKEKWYINEVGRKKWEFLKEKEDKSLIHIVVSLPQDSIVKIRTEVESAALKKCTYRDSCLLIVGKNYGRYALEEGDSKHVGDTLGVLPIPDITCLKEYPLSNNFWGKAVIYVLDAGKGIYAGEAGKKEKNMPSDWQHGYSKGITFIDNYIDYWCVVW